MVKYYLVFMPDTAPHLLRTVRPEDFTAPDVVLVEIKEELWDHLEANRDEIKLYALTPEGDLRKMTQEEYDLLNPVVVTENP